MTSLPDTGGGPSLLGRLVAVLAVGFLLWLIGWLAPIVAPLGMALFLAALSAPVFTWLVGRGRSRVLAMAITVVLILGIGGAILVLGILSVQSLSDSLSAYSSDLAARYPSLSGVPAAIREAITADDLTAFLRNLISTLWSVGSDLAFAIIVAALLLLDAPRLLAFQAQGLGEDNPVIRQAPAVARAAVTYFAVRVRVNAVTALGLLALMLVLGIDDPLLWAVGSFFLSFVPYLGLILAMIPPTILAFAESGPVPALVFVIGGTALNVIAENVLEPTLTGRALQLSTWIVFIMFFFWVWLLGPVGALLAMPITVLIVLVLRTNERTVWMAKLISRDEAERAPPGSSEVPAA
jgi:predicted PurR-regulated permease PerM